MNKFKLNIKSLCLVIFCIPFLSACEKEKPKPVVEDTVENMVMIYAVNHNNLSNDLINNRQQIFSITKNLDLKKTCVLMYNYNSETVNPTLSELSLDSAGNPAMHILKSYDISTLSVDPSRIKSVIDDVSKMHPKAKKSLFLWGHGYGPINPTKYSANAVASSAPPVQKSFGGENANGRSQFIDLDALAECIPDGVFETIWFDCCYMGSVEVMYEFKGKCNWFVGYPTEIMAAGLPYNKILPHLFAETPDRKAAAQALFDHYNSIKEPVTVGVIDMAFADKLAEVVKKVITASSELPSTTGLQNYSTLSNLPYFDFGQLIKETISLIAAKNPAKGEILLSEFNEVMDKLVVYKGASALDFRFPYQRPIDSEKFNGLNCYFFKGGNTERDGFYRKLKWYKDVYSTSQYK